MFDFTKCKTVEELEEELNLITSAYTRLFIDKELEKLYPLREMPLRAREINFRFFPELSAGTNRCVVRLMFDAINPASSKEISDMCDAGLSYVHQVIQPELTASLKMWHGTEERQMA